MEEEMAQGEEHRLAKLAAEIADKVAAGTEGAGQGSGALVLCIAASLFYRLPARLVFDSD